MSPAALGWQGFGAFVAIVLGGIWVAREHLRGVWRTALGKDDGVSDRDEIMGYRTALVGIALGIVYILFWLTRIGIHPGVALLLLFAVITLYLGLTRIVIEGGLVFVRGPLVPQAYAMHLIGPADLTGSTMTGLGLSYGWACDPIATFMPFGANAARVTQRASISSRRLSHCGWIGTGYQFDRVVLFFAQAGLCFGCVQFWRVGLSPRGTGAL